MATPQALAMAQERGYDLVEVAPMAAPPVVKFLDFGQYKYELTKRDKEAKRRQRSVTFKEVRLTPKIGSGDFDTKVHRAIEFLEDGDRIKVTVRFRGRELTHPELGRNMLTRFTDRIKEHGTPERTPLLEGKSMHLTVASLHKPKEHEAPVRPPRADTAPAVNGAEEAQTAKEPAAATQAPEPVAAAPVPAAKAEPVAEAEPTIATPAPEAAPVAKAEPEAETAEPAAVAPAPVATKSATTTKTTTATADQPKAARQSKTKTTAPTAAKAAAGARTSSEPPASAPAAPGE
jgi:translation initiation factor IF-3